MFQRTKTLILVLLLSLSLPFTASAASDLEKGYELLGQIQSALIDISEKVKPAVVNISPVSSGPPAPAPKNQRGGPRDTPAGSGSGVIIDASGYIVTNNHVVGSALFVEVRLSDKSKFKGEVIGKDPDTDLAVVKITTDKPLHFVKLGDSSKAKVGQTVIAVGNPFGLDRTVTVGVISALGRENVNLSRYEDFIQTDASINPGNSGGPLFDIHGDVIGINTAIINFAQGIGFAIPSNMVRAVTDQLRDKGKVSRGWLGVGIQPLTEELSKKFGVKEGSGVLINEVFEGDPASNGGVQPGDIILSVNGKMVDTPNTLARVIAGYTPGNSISIMVLRDGTEKELTIDLIERKEDMLSASSPRMMQKYLGLTVETLTDELVAQYKLKETDEGVVITGVEEESVSAKEGLKPGDLIREINRQKIKDAKGFNKVMREIKATETVLMRVTREGRAFFIVLKPRSDGGE